MPKLLSVEQVQVDGGYDISVISDGGRIWVVLTAQERGGIVRFWSSRADTGVHPVPPLEVVRCVRQRVLGAQGERIGGDRALVFWPEGWDCWGSGVPAEVDEYFRTQFGKDLEIGRDECQDDGVLQGAGAEPGRTGGDRAEGAT